MTSEQVNSSKNGRFIPIFCFYKEMMKRLKGILLTMEIVPWIHVSNKWREGDALNCNLNFRVTSSIYTRYYWMSWRWCDQLQLDFSSHIDQHHLLLVIMTYLKQCIDHLIKIKLFFLVSSYLASWGWPLILILTLTKNKIK